MPPRRVYVDLSTAFAERNRIPHGTTRVERKLIEALAKLGRDNIFFARFDIRNRQFVSMSSAEALATATTVPVADARRQARASTITHPFRARLLELEVWVRRNVRDPIRRVRGWLIRKSGLTPNIFEPGSVLLLAGELQRQDFGQLMALRRRLDLRLVFVFYDLLGTLSNNDPRALDPNATNIPGTEFILREGALVLPISHYSETELRNHAAKRGMSLMPVQTIRLGHLIDDVQDIGSVAGLTAGQFVLSVGDVTHRKNHKVLTDIWSALAGERGTSLIPLVIAGRISTDGQPLAAAIAADAVASKVITILSDVDDAKLNWLYRNCRFTLFPSFCEGFGLPVAESLAFGKPCIASNATSIPEASQGVALHLDPHDASAWRSAIEEFLDDDAALARLQQDIAMRFRPVSWNQTAEDALLAISGTT